MTKTSLEWKEKIAVAYAHYCLGHKMQDITVHYPGINQGRIAEACSELRLAAAGSEKGKILSEGVEVFQREIRN